MFIKFNFPQLFFHLFVTAFAFTIYFNTESSQHYWILYTALSFSLLVINQEFIYRPKQLFVITLLLCALCFANNFIASHFSVLIFLLVLTFCAIYLVGYYNEYFLAAIIIISFNLVCAYQSLSLQQNIERTYFILFGGLSVIVWHLLFLANSNLKIMQVNLLHALFELQALFEQMFVCLLTQDYVDNQYIYEHRLHTQKNIYFYYLRNLKEFNSRIKDEKTGEYYTALINKLDLLFDIFAECAQVRYRVSDHSTFQLCNKELFALAYAIHDALIKLIRAIKKNKPTKFDVKLVKAIQAFDENFQNVLKTSAREPLVFFLFIHSLKKIHEGLFEINQLLPFTGQKK